MNENKPEVSFSQPDVPMDQVVTTQETAPARTSYFLKDILLMMLGADNQFFFHENFDAIVADDSQWTNQDEQNTRTIVSAIRRGVSQPCNLMNIQNGELIGIKGVTPIPSGTYALYPVPPEAFK